MDVNHDNPIVINSDDEDDDDDVVLVKEEKEDDVIFVSENSSMLEMKRKLGKKKSPKNNTALISRKSDLDISCSIPHVGYFQSAYSSFSLVDDILRPLGVSNSGTLTIDTLPTVVNKNEMQINQPKSNSVIEPEQGLIVLDKPRDICDSGVLASPSVSGDIVNSTETVLCPSIDYSNSIHPDMPQHSESAPTVFVRRSDPDPGTIKHYSGSINFPVLEQNLNTKELQVTKKTSNNTNPTQSMDFSNINDLFDFLDLIPSNNISEMQNKSAFGGKSSSESNLIPTSNGASKLGNSVSTNQILMPRSKESTVTKSLLTITNDVSQGLCSTAATYQQQESSFLLPSNSSTMDFVNEQPQKSSTSSMFPSQNDNQLSTLVYQSSAARSHFLNQSLCPKDIDKNLNARLKYFSSFPAPLDRKVNNVSRKIIRSKNSTVRYNLEQIRKRRLNIYKRGLKVFIRLHTNALRKRASSDRLNVKVGETDASQWQIVPSGSTVGKIGAQIDSPTCQFSEKKRINVLEESAKEKQSLKVKFKRYPSTEYPTSHSKNSGQDHPYKIGLKKSFIRRQAHQLGKESSCNNVKSSASNHYLGSENGQRKLEGQKGDVKICVTCKLNISEEKHSNCGQGHVICASCLEPQVRGILTGVAKQKYINCPSITCFDVVHFDELKKTLPSFVVEILEEKLDKEYMNYITKWMFTDEQLKSRSEFATFDTSMTLCPTLSATKYDEVDNYVSRDKAADLPAQDLPSTWAPMERGVPVMAFEVVPDTDEYRALACQFYETLNFGDYDIVKIIRVQNPILWKYFSLKQSEMRQENEGVDVKEKQLYHGTHRSTLEAIARKGFDWRLSGKHGTAYGCGSYFASKASYSHSYTDRAGNGMSVTAGGGYMLPTSTGSNSFLTRLAPLWGPFWGPPAYVPQADLNVPSPPPAHGQLSTLNQAPISSSVGPTLTTSNNPSDRTNPRTASTSYIIPGSRIVRAYHSCFSSPYTSNLYRNHPVSPQIQPSSSSFTQILDNLSTSSNKSTPPLPLIIPTLSVDSSYFSGSPANIPGISCKLNASKDLNEDRPTKSSTSKISQIHDMGTADLAKTFTRDPSSKTHFMFVAKVLVGRHTIGRSGLKRPPPLDEKNPYGKSYDSCVDNNVFPQIYVIFDSNQAYPEYVIEYNWHKG